MIKKIMMAALVGLSGMSLAQSVITEEPLRFLALGDSYTIGQNVRETERWPVQLIEAIKKEYGIRDAEVDIIARTGWTTANLKNGINQQLDTSEKYNLASLLIGVNNQYQFLDFGIYEPDFRELLDIAIEAVGGDRKKVFVVSIPDYAYTPSFANNATVSQQIDAYNEVNAKVAKEYGIAYFNITPISRRGLATPDLVADDELHPSGSQYKLWVELMLPNIYVSAVETDSITSIRYIVNQDQLSLELPAKGGRLEMFDSSGRLMANMMVTNQMQELNVGQWSPGIYYLNYRFEERAYSGKLFID